MREVGVRVKILHFLFDLFCGKAVLFFIDFQEFQALGITVVNNIWSCLLFLLHFPKLLKNQVECLLAQDSRTSYIM